MNIKLIVLLVTTISVLLFGPPSLKASEFDHCQPYTSVTGSCKEFSEAELNSIRASNNANLIMGAGIVNLVTDSTSSVGREFIELANRIESPKGIATISLIAYNLDPSRNLPLKLLKEDIAKLLQADKDNALSYYLNALLLQEEGADQKALAQIKKGNVYKFNGYPKQRFYAIAQVAEMAKCGGRLSREHAFWNSNSAAIYLKLRHLCQKLKKEYGQEAQDACMVMGKNLEATSLTCLEDLFSLAIQTESLNDSPSDDVTRSEIKKRRDVAFACGARTVDIPETDVTEEVDKQYYEILLDKGEASAQKFIGDFANRKHNEN